MLFSYYLAYSFIKVKSIIGGAGVSMLVQMEDTARLSLVQVSTVMLRNSGFFSSSRITMHSYP